MKQIIILIILVGTPYNMYAQSSTDTIKPRKITFNTTLGIHSLAYVGIPGSYLSSNPNIDATCNVNFPWKFSFILSEARDVRDASSTGNYILLGVTKKFLVKRLSLSGTVYYIDYQIKKFFDNEQPIVMPSMSVQYDRSKWFIMSRWSYMSMRDNNLNGHINELSIGVKSKFVIVSTHMWHNSGTFLSDRGISTGLRIKPTFEIPIWKIKGSIIFDGNINITNRMDETKKAAAKEALVIRTYWSF